jgi:hypothetical protein
MIEDDIITSVALGPADNPYGVEYYIRNTFGVYSCAYCKVVTATNVHAEVPLQPTAQLNHNDTHLLLARYVQNNARDSWESEIHVELEEGQCHASADDREPGLRSETASGRFTKT